MTRLGPSGSARGVPLPAFAATGALLLPLEAAAMQPPAASRVRIGGHWLRRKGEFHVTILGRALGPRLRALFDEPDLQLALASLDWRVQRLHAYDFLGKLKPALQRAFKTQDIGVPADLGSRTEAALRQAALDRLGMEARAGNLINGAERVETAARSGKVHLLIHAADSGDDGRRALDQAWRVGGGGSQGMIFPEARTILSMALGRENVVHVALTDPAAASRVAHALARWRAFTGPDRGP